MRLLFAVICCLFVSTEVSGAENDLFNYGSAQDAAGDIYSDGFDDETLSGNPKIKEKLVPDEYINDRNSFMGDFGLKPEGALFGDEGFNLNSASKKNSKTYNKIRLEMENPKNTENVWKKDNLIIEGILSAGALSYNMFSVSERTASQSWDIVPYFSLHFRFGNGSLLMPEFYIQESGDFKFDRIKVKTGSGKAAFNKYYLKLPLGIPVPFFKWKSYMAADASYSNIYGNWTLNENVMINNAMHGSGEKIYASTTELIVRLYLDTPVVLNPSIMEHSYFGVYYSEFITPRSASPGTNFAGCPPLIVSTNSRAGGFFYDMRKDVYKGIIFGVEVYGGYSSVEVSNGGSSFGASFGNINGLLAVKGKVSLGYEHIFKDYGLGVAFDISAEYNTVIPYIFAQDTKKYKLGYDGELRYYAALSFTFSY